MPFVYFLTYSAVQTTVFELLSFQFLLEFGPGAFLFQVKCWILAFLSVTQSLTLDVYSEPVPEAALEEENLDLDLLMKLFLFSSLLRSLSLSLSLASMMAWNFSLKTMSSRAVCLNSSLQICIVLSRTHLVYSSSSVKQQPPIFYFLMRISSYLILIASGD